METQNQEIKPVKKLVIPTLTGIAIIIFIAIILFGGVFAYQYFFVKTQTLGDIASVQGIYKKEFASISVTDLGQNKIKISGNAIWEGSGAVNGQVNSGDIDGVVVLDNNKGVYKNQDCEIELTFSENKLYARDNNRCGGLNVSFTGNYTKESISGNNQTAGWKTYTNSEYGLEFKYPDGLDRLVGTLVYPVNGQTSCKSDKLYSNLALFINDEISISSICEKVDTNNIKQPTITEGSIVSKIGKTMIADKESYEYSSSYDRTVSGLGGFEVVRTIIIPINDRAIQVNFFARFLDTIPRTLNEDGSLTGLGKQIISTFKFLNPVISQKIDSSFLVGKTYDYFCASGEWGTFKNDGSIVVNHGTSQGDNPIAPIVAKWEFKNDQLTISSANKLISSAKNFKLYNFSGETFAVSEGNGCDSMIIGPDSIKNEEFYNSAPSSYFKAGANLTSDQIFQEVSAWQGFHNKLSYFRIFGQDKVEFSFGYGPNFAYKMGGKWYLAGKGEHQDLANCIEYASVPKQYNPGCIDQVTGQAKYMKFNANGTATSVNYPPSQMTSYIGE